MSIKCVYMSFCPRICANVWALCRPMCVKRKSPIQSPVSVCGRGGALFHTQPVGNSSPFPLEGSFAYPAILYSLFFPSAARQQERNWENPAQGCCLPAQHWPKDLDDPYGAVPLIGAMFSLTCLKFGTDLKGKQQKEKNSILNTFESGLLSINLFLCSSPS